MKGIFLFYQKRTAVIKHEGTKPRAVAEMRDIVCRLPSDIGKLQSNLGTQSVYISYS